MRKFFIVLIFSIILCSCTESTGSGTLKIVIQQTAGKTISPQASASRIVKYNVTGSGPGGKTFSKDSSSKTISIDGLSNGTWTVSAAAITSSGQKILAGEKTFKFSGSFSSETIYLDTEVGSGTLHLTFNWDSSVTSPSAKIIIQGISLSYSASYTVEIPSGETSYSFTKKNLNSGSYIVTVLLYNAGNSAGGFCEVFSIVNTVTTSGTISLKSETTSLDEDSRISLSTSDGYTVNGVISDMDNSLTIDSDYAISLDLTSNLSTSDTLYVTWYEDGVILGQSEILVQNSTEALFTAKKGSHIINVVVESKQSKDASSAEFRYTGYTDDAKGSAVEIGSILVDNPQNIRLDTSTIIGCLPDEKIIVLSPDFGTLQLCHIASNTLILETNGTYSFSLEDYSWLCQSKLLISNPKSYVFCISDSETDFTLLKYNSKSNQIEIAKRASDDSNARYEGIYSEIVSPLKEVSSGCISITGDTASTILLSDNKSNLLMSIAVSDIGVEEEHILLKNSTHTDCHVIAASKKHIITCNNSTVGHLLFSGKWATSSWTFTEESRLSNPKKALIYNDSNILVMDDNRIVRLGITSDFSSYNYNGSLDIVAVDMCLSPDGDYFYAITSDGILYSFATNYVGYFKELKKINTEHKLKQVVASNSTVTVVDEDGNIYLFDISKGEV